MFAMQNIQKLTRMIIFYYANPKRINTEFVEKSAVNR